MGLTDIKVGYAYIGGDKMMTYILMRFYGGGGLANYKIVNCDEENELFDECVKFEQECVRQNLGEFIGILDLDEFDAIKKEI